MLHKIPSQIKEVLKKLETAGFEAYIVGGCVRDLVMDREPSDWDAATNAKPEEIIKIFPDSFYENDFGTVGVKVEKFTEGEGEHDVVEVTTYRTEGIYSDKRRPDAVEFAETLEEDLKRRDFTINAIALRISNFQFPISNQDRISNDKNLKKIPDIDHEIVDLFGGQTDLKNKIIRAVGNPEERFSEDALRMMRAIRFAITLNGNSKLETRNSKHKEEINLWEIEKKTFEAIRKNSKNLKFVSQERIQDELVKILLSENPAEGIEMLHEVGLLEYIIPELEKGIGVGQNRHHIHNIWEHNLLSLKFCPSKKLEVRLAALLHDIAKPQTKRGEGEFSTFYNHDHVGARVAKKILERLRFSNEVIQKVYLLIDNHMFYYNVDEVTESSVRRLIRKVGLENMQDLIDLRIADRLGSGTPKAKPYKLRHLEYIIEKVSNDAVSVKMLKINGNDLMQELGMKPSPKIGAVLDVLLSEVIEDASRNEKNILLTRAQELVNEDLEKLRDMAKEKIEEKKEEDEQEIKSKHWVK